MIEKLIFEDPSQSVNIGFAFHLAVCLEASHSCHLAAKQFLSLIF